MKNKCKFIIVFFVSIVVACDKNIEDVENPYSENANSLIINQRIYGNENEQTTFFKTLKLGSNLLISGKESRKSFLAKVSTSGSIVWKTNLNFESSSIYVSENIIIVTGIYNRNVGIVALFDLNGNFIYEHKFDNYNIVAFSDISESFVNLVCPVNSKYQSTYNLEKLFYVVGGVKDKNEIFPAIFYFTIKKDNSLSVELPEYMNFQNVKIFRDLSGFCFSNIGRALNFFGGTSSGSGGDRCGSRTSGNSDFTEYITAYKLKSDNLIKKVELFKLKFNIVHELNISSDCIVDFIEITNHVNVVWQTPIKTTSISNIEFYGADNLYVMTNSFVEKQDGKSWKVGNITKVSHEGGIEWTKDINLSNLDDILFDMKKVDKDLFLCGRYAAASYEKNKCIGYGVLLKVDAETGDLLSKKYFGNKLFETGFNGLCVDNSRIYLTGFTEKRITSSYKGYFVEIEK